MVRVKVMCRDKGRDRVNGKCRGSVEGRCRCVECVSVIRFHS